MTGQGDQGENLAMKLAQGNPMAGSTTKPGDGPSKEGGAGYYDVLMIGENINNQSIKLSIKGDKDPGYGSTSKMIAESGIWLAENPFTKEEDMDTCILGESLVEKLEKTHKLVSKKKHNY